MDGTSPGTADGQASVVGDSGLALAPVRAVGARAGVVDGDADAELSVGVGGALSLAAAAVVDGVDVGRHRARAAASRFPRELRGDRAHTPSRRSGRLAHGRRNGRGVT